MEMEKILPLPDLTVKFSEETPVFQKLKELKSEKKQPIITKTKTEDPFFFPVSRDDTRIQVDDYRYLKRFPRFLDSAMVEEKRTLKIRNLPFGFYEKQIFHYFKQFGGIVQVSVVRDDSTGEPSELGYIEYGNSEVAELVRDHFVENPLLYDANKVIVTLEENDTKTHFPRNFQESKILLMKHESNVEESYNPNNSIYSTESERKTQNSLISKYESLRNEGEIDEMKKNNAMEMEKENKGLENLGIDYKYVPLKRKCERDDEIEPKTKKQKTE